MAEAIERVEIKAKDFSEFWKKKFCNDRQIGHGLAMFMICEGKPPKNYPINLIVNCYNRDSTYRNFDCDFRILVRNISFYSFEIKERDIEDFINEIQIKSKREFKKDDNNLFRVIFRNCSFDQLLSIEQFNQIEYEFDNIQVNKIKIVVDRNILSKDEPKLLIKDSEITGHICIEEGANLRGAKFEYVSMDKVELDAKYADLVQIKSTVGTKFPVKIEKKKRDEISKQNIFFAKLKKRAEDQHDKVLSMYYYSAYLDAYYETITWKKNFSENLSLAFLKYSTNFNRSWLQGIGIFIGIAFISYIFVLVSTDRLTWENFWNKYFLQDFFSFINPLAIDFDEWNVAKFMRIKADGWVLFVLYVTKILVLMMYFQIIQAFRKFRV